MKQVVTLKLFPVSDGEKLGLNDLSKEPPFKKTAPIFTSELLDPVFLTSVLFKVYEVLKPPWSFKIACTAGIIVEGSKEEHETELLKVFVDPVSHLISSVLINFTVKL